MILSEEEIRERLESPLNLMNRLRDLGKSVNGSLSPCLPPKSGEIIKDLDEKLSKESLAAKASAILDSSMDELKTRVREAKSPKELATIAESMSRVISNANNNGGGETKGQIVIYAPTFVSEDHFNTIHEKDVA